jgi:hypothetical protein
VQIEKRLAIIYHIAYRDSEEGNPKLTMMELNFDRIVVRPRFYCVLLQFVSDPTARTET